jgi:hypothetical protein
MLENQIGHILNFQTELNLIKSRKKSRGMALNILIREIKEIQSEISDINSEIRQISLNLNELDNKRVRLNQMNFASSEHLKKTHKRYWEQVQKYTKEISQKFETLSVLENKQYEKKIKLSHLRSEIKSLIRQEEELINLQFANHNQMEENFAIS